MITGVRPNPFQSYTLVAPDGVPLDAGNPPKLGIYTCSGFGPLLLDQEMVDTVELQAEEMLGAAHGTLYIPAWRGPLVAHRLGEGPTPWPETEDACWTLRFLDTYP